MMPTDVSASKRHGTQTHTYEPEYTLSQIKMLMFYNYCFIEHLRALHYMNISILISFYKHFMLIKGCQIITCVSLLFISALNC